MEHCLGSLCFVPLDAAKADLFGFSEYLATLALMVVAWTISDVRHRFRIATAPFPLHGLTFIAIASIGILTLLTDLWRYENWLVPKGPLLTPTIWQAILGAAFLLTFLIWAWLAFIKPPKFGKRNAKRFASFLYHKIIDGSPTEMAALAQELIRSVPALIRNAPNHRRMGGYFPEETPSKPTEFQLYANDILLLIGDPRFCRTLVASSPGTILAIFQEIARSEKFGISIAQFGRNVVTAAIENQDSFMYHEAEGYDSGLLGYVKPVSQSIFGNYSMADQVDTLLDIDYRATQKWSAIEWEAYSRAVLAILKSYVDEGKWQHSFILSRALSTIERSASDIYKINGLDDGNWDHDSVQRLGVSVHFCEEAIKILENVDSYDHVHLRIRPGDPIYFESFFDRLVDLMLEIILSAAAVRKPRSLSWAVQYGTVWGRFFGGLSKNGKAAKIIKFKLRRKIYNEIVSATEWPNYKNIKLLSFCLNVMGLRPDEAGYQKESTVLHKALLAWTKRNFVILQKKSPQVFNDCLSDGLSYDARRCRLIATCEINAFRTEPECFYFNLERPKKNQ